MHSFAQNPIKWLINNDLEEIANEIVMLDLIPGFSKTKRDPFKYKELERFIHRKTYGNVYCANCSKLVDKLSPTSKNRFALTCSEDCRQALASKRQHGANNTCHRMTLETKQLADKKIALTLKNKILSGEYTPKSENYRMKSMIEFKYHGIKRKVRSLWEVIFWLQFPNLEYETIRVKYYDTTLKRERIYITDFYDPTINMIYEIKPKKYQHTLKDKKPATITAGYNYTIIDEAFLMSLDESSLIEELLVLEITEKEKRIKGICDLFRRLRRSKRLKNQQQSIIYT